MHTVHCWKYGVVLCDNNAMLRMRTGLLLHRIGSFLVHGCTVDVTLIFWDTANCSFGVTYICTSPPHYSPASSDHVTSFVLRHLITFWTIFCFDTNLFGIMRRPKTVLKVTLDFDQDLSMSIRPVFFEVHQSRQNCEQGQFICYVSELSLHMIKKDSKSWNGQRSQIWIWCLMTYCGRRYKPVHHQTVSVVHATREDFLLNVTVFWPRLVAAAGK